MTSSKNNSNKGEITRGSLRHRLEQIACTGEYPACETLLFRGGDCWDVTEIGVGTLRRLLEEAFQAGMASAHNEHLHTVVDGEGEEYDAADYQSLHPAPEVLASDEDARRVGTHGTENQWLALGGYHALVYTTWVPAVGWTLQAATYTEETSGGYQLKQASEPFAFTPKTKGEANAKALAWAINR